MTAAAARWAAVPRVLCVRLDSVGDVLMTSPAMRALKAAHPGRRLTLLTSPAGASAAALLPELDDVIVYDPPWMKATPTGDGTDTVAPMAARLRERRFDAAVVFTVYSQSPLPAALLCLMAGIPLRLAHCRENPYQLLSDWVAEPEPAGMVRHEVRRQLDLVATVGARTEHEHLAVAVPTSAERTVAALLADADLALPARWIALHPGASAPSRRYPAEGFAAAGRALVALGHRLVVVGATDEVPLAAAITRAIGAGAVSLAGRTTIPELAALLRRAALLIANNSGPMHVAASVGTPVVALYALTNPQHTPWRVPSRVLNHDVPCRYCYRSTCPELHHDCLLRVPPDAIVSAARALLDETAAGRRGPAPPPADRALEAHG